MFKLKCTILFLLFNIGLLLAWEQSIEVTVKFHRHEASYLQTNCARVFEQVFNYTDIEFTTTGDPQLAADLVGSLGRQRLYLNATFKSEFALYRQGNQIFLSLRKEVPPPEALKGSIQTQIIKEKFPVTFVDGTYIDYLKGKRVKLAISDDNLQKYYHGLMLRIERLIRRRFANGHNGVPRFSAEIFDPVPLSIEIKGQELTLEARGLRVRLSISK